MKKGIFALLCVMIIGCIVPTSSFAALPNEEELSPHASAYLTEYTAWAVRSSSNQVYVYYDVTGNGTVGCLGAKLVVIQMKDGSSWETVKTYTGTTSNGMLKLNFPTHSGDIVYKGSAGNQYRAVVTIFGGSSTSHGDSRIVTTNVV